mmetsp:Transcript_9932/g.21067  ORF Transcript_9932/g.21067 Transcript_9932/m.21067 type:complete len:591 (+) Transcript_9932:131-1903(+)
MVQASRRLGLAALLLGGVLGASPRSSQVLHATTLQAADDDFTDSSPGLSIRHVPHDQLDDGTGAAAPGERSLKEVVEITAPPNMGLGDVFFQVNSESNSSRNSTQPLSAAKLESATATAAAAPVSLMRREKRGDGAAGSKGSGVHGGSSNTGAKDGGTATAQNATAAEEGGRSESTATLAAKPAATKKSLLASLAFPLAPWAIAVLVTFSFLTCCRATRPAWSSWGLFRCPSGMCCASERRQPPLEQQPRKQPEDQVQLSTAATPALSDPAPPPERKQEEPSQPKQRAPSGIAVACWGGKRKGQADAAVAAAPVDTSPRARVEALPLCSAVGVATRLPETRGYDCALPRPLSIPGLVRLQCRVDGPISDEPLQAPLTQQPCVMYTAVASRLVHGGVHPVTVAYAEMHTDFNVSLLDAMEPPVQVQISGAEVSLFDMKGGSFLREASLAAAPDHWQEFLVERKASMKHLEMTENVNLEFQECTLQIGASVTVVGELLRDSFGKLLLQPAQRQRPPSRSLSGQPEPAALPPLPPLHVPEATLREPWRTSWECGGLPIEKAEGEKMVLLSDDPSLLVSWNGPEGAGDAMFSTA